MATVTTPGAERIARNSHHDPPQNLRAFSSLTGTYNPWSALVVAWDNQAAFAQITRSAPGISDTTTEHSNTDFVTLTGLHPGKTYTFEVKLGTASNDLGPAETTEFSTVDPPKPQDLQTSTLLSNQIELQWSRDFLDESGIKTHVERTQQGSNTPDYTAEDNGVLTQHTDPGSFESGDQYTYSVWFSVQADSQRYPGQKVTLDVTVPFPYKPLELTVRTSPGSISLNWRNPPERTITRHRVERRQGTSGLFETVHLRNAGATSFGDHTVEVTGGTTYQYRVRVGDADTWGDFTQIEATTPELPTLTVPTNFRVINGTLNNGVYEMTNSNSKPELEWDVGQASTGNYLTRQLIEPPAGAICEV